LITEQHDGSSETTKKPANRMQAEDIEVPRLAKWGGQNAQATYETV
jgi:hypothetical protein